MKVREILNIREGKVLLAKSEFDKRGTPMKLPSMYDNKDWGSVKKVSPKTVTVKSSGKDGKVYTHRTIWSK